jgi:hypothetical protein
MATDSSHMEKDQNISRIDHSYLKMSPNKAEGPKRYSILKVSIEGSFVGLAKRVMSQAGNAEVE